MYLVEIEMAVLIALQLFPFAKRKPTAAPQAEAPKPEVQAKPWALDVLPVPATHVEIVKRSGEKWLHVGHREIGHPDVHEALATPGLALRYSDGQMMEGKR